MSYEIRGTGKGINGTKQVYCLGFAETMEEAEIKAHEFVTQGKYKFIHIIVEESKEKVKELS